MDRTLDFQFNIDMTYVTQQMTKLGKDMAAIGLKSKELAYFMSLEPIPANWERVWVET